MQPLPEGKNVLRLFPAPAEPVPLHGLYLRAPLRPTSRERTPFVYTNFIASLDGRISLPDLQTAKRGVPRAIANARDWRLFQELAACADSLVMSARYIRDLPHGVTARSFPVSVKPEHGDLVPWRLAHGLTPQPAIVIVTASLELPSLVPLVEAGRSVYVATGNAADPRKIARIEADGARVLRVGAGARAEGGRLIEALAQERHRTIAMLGGGEALHALVVDDVLDRLYLTLACRMLGGHPFDTLLTGPVLEPAARFRVAALHYDAASPEAMPGGEAIGAGASGGGAANIEQLFAVLDRPPRTAGVL
jgi:riboflavin biosynthesis pyrimidine reductase